MLPQILSSKIRAEVFRMLFGISDQELHMREMERRSGFVIGTIQSELKKLLRLDLVKKRKDGNRMYYRANRGHPLYPELHSLVLKTNGLVDVIREAFMHDSKIKTAFVFGSVARHEEQAGSDVDIMIIGNLGLRKVTGMLSGVSDKIGREINPHVMSEEEFIRRKKNKEHFIAQVIEEPKIFIIGNENEFEAMG